MTYDVKEVYTECLKQFVGSEGRECLGDLPLSNRADGKLSEEAASIIDALINGKDFPSTLRHKDEFECFYSLVKNAFLNYYKNSNHSDFFDHRAEIIFNSNEELSRAQAISELWSPDLTLSDMEIYNRWKLSKVKENNYPYRPDEILIQLNALYSPCGSDIPDWLDGDLALKYNNYIKGSPPRIAVYDHPVPIFSCGKDHELENCLLELNSDVDYEKECGILPKIFRLPVLISISTTHEGLDRICEIWLNRIITKSRLLNIDCYLLSENKARRLTDIIGEAADIFTVQGKYACHFGALKYAQLIFEKAIGIRAGFKLDTDEGIHSRDLKDTTGKTWFEHLCHPYWGGTAENSYGERVSLGFNIGEYVDSRDLDRLGYEKAIRTPEVKSRKDLRGSFLLFNKTAAQAKGTLILNKSERLDDFISHPLVKGGGYGVDNNTLRTAVPVGFSMVGRAEDQQFYFSALKYGFQGIFNPNLRIIHYKDSVSNSEMKNMTARNVADIYRMLLFHEMMTELDVIDSTRPFPSVYASPLAPLQAFILWVYFIFKSSAEGNEQEAEEYLSEGRRQLIPLMDDITEGRVMTRFEDERDSWTLFVSAISKLTQKDALSWIELLRV